MGTGPAIFITRPFYLVPCGTGTVVPIISKPLDLMWWTAHIFSSHRKIYKPWDMVILSPSLS